MSAANTLHVAHGSKLSGHFKFAKTMVRFGNFYWRHIAHDEKDYVDGYMVCQQAVHGKKLEENYESYLTSNT